MYVRMESRRYSPSWRSLAMAVVGATAGLLSLATSSSDAAAATPVRIGVVLDLTSETGRKSLACISMALEDFYLQHPTYTTRAEVHVRDTRGELATAADAVLVAEELMNKNAYVRAIIAPHVSAAEVELFASIAKRGDVPILSFSAVSPPASSSRSWAVRFVVRTAGDGGSQQQAAAIAAVLEAFAWRAAVLLHEDSLYGIDILPALVNAFQGRANSLAVPADATDSRLDAALRAAKGMPARVYIVHMPPALAARLFLRAMAAGMMSEGYAWIATAGVGGAADSLNPGDIDYIQGVLSLRPHVQATDQLRSFSRRFKARYFRQEEDSNDAVHHRHRTVPPVWLLWLYDTAWATATAAEVSFGRTTTTTQGAPALVDALLHTEFDGLAGRFKLIDGQLQFSAYEIVNTVGEGGGRTVGFWTPESGITTRLRPKSGNELKQILWPGETAVTPVGWSESPGGRPLRVAVPVKSGFRQFVNISGQPRTERVTGYCIDVFHEVMTTKLGYSVAYHVNDSADRPYDELVNLVQEKNADVLVGDVTITASRMKRVSFTVPFADPGWSMIVAEDDMSNNMWIFLKPLTPGLWLTSLAFFFFTGFVVWVIEHRINHRFRGTTWKQFGVIFYFAFSTLVFSHKEKLESNLSKMVVIIWVFAVLILTTSYTASLSSMLTVRQLQPTINLLGGRDYVGYQQGSFIAGLLKEMGFDEARLKGYNTMDEYADALKKGSENGGVTVIFDEVPYLRLFLSRYCRGYAMTGPTYKSGGFGFVFPLGSPLVQDVSRAILELAEEEKLARIESKWFGHPGTCVSATGDDSSAFRLDVRRFGGLFLVNAAVSGLVLLVHLIAKFVSRERGGGEVAAGALPRMRAWLRRFDALEGPPLGVDQERNGRRVAVATEQEEAAVRDFTSVDTTSMELDAMDYRRNHASLPPASGDTLPPATVGWGAFHRAVCSSLGGGGAHAAWMTESKEQMMWTLRRQGNDLAGASNDLILRIKRAEVVSNDTTMSVESVELNRAQMIFF